MGIIDRLKSMVGLEKEEAFRRWSATELADKKAYLESKSPGSFTAADHYLSAEWVIQRYLPEGDEPTDEQWSKKNQRDKAEDRHKYKNGCCWNTAQ
ncbi:hypothetical protein [Pseudomonas aeruginosa]|uniref:hypothetical protein n=1 Tax=Pseudomonas aeruginosa TaxID=287 RepID=UPI003749130E